MSGTTENTFLPEPHTPEPHAHGNHTHGEVQGRKAGVVIASTRAAAGIYEDETGPVIIDWLTEHGFEAYPAMVVPDGEPVGAAIRALLTQHPAVVITSGGTGLSPDDRTPDVTLPLLDREIPGIMEAIRRAGAAKTPLAVLSRGYAGAAGRTFIINLPGSPKGVMDGLAVLDPVIGHLCDQLEGRNGH
ncbi:MogA/MoaB family molybdenum cofactor biosynthesis protein [Pseudarthrobacter sp. TAF60_1]|uniref:MogA/MoaB family molybdenum cofactor biosynthesis protein n=1 Tax=Pseudarthrobacter sp. TAF60_1 TaxID=3233071 RepID=UPI003F94EDF7